MLAGRVMSPIVLAVSQDASIYDAAETMVSAEVSALPVVDGAGKMVGILSEADLMHRPEIGTEPRKGWLQRVLGDSTRSAEEYVALHSRRVRDVMTGKVVTVDEETPLSEIARLMDQHKIKRVPVIRGETVVGIISRGNLLRALLSCDPQQPASPQSDEALRRAVEAAVKGQAWQSPWPVNVIVNAGVAHLWGFVGSEASSTAYRVAAENVPGVRKVKNHLRRVPHDVGMGV
ncbi:MAG: CBS domain-containing protein [Proteobacteria bacterium]|nr:CBS domain-containing protein [Pseudomonadota bacterium]